MFTQTPFGLKQISEMTEAERDERETSGVTIIGWLCDLCHRIPTDDGKD